MDHLQNNFSKSSFELRLTRGGPEGRRLHDAHQGWALCQLWDPARCIRPALTSRVLLRSSKQRAIGSRGSHFTRKGARSASARYDVLHFAMRILHVGSIFFANVRVIVRATSVQAKLRAACRVQAMDPRVFAQRCCSGEPLPVLPPIRCLFLPAVACGPALLNPVLVTEDGPLRAALGLPHGHAHRPLR